ncbi:MAG: DHHW family protein [Sarcina sp.]
MKKNNTLICVFFGVLGVMTLFDIVNSQKVFSDIENRYLSKKPKIDKEKILSGKFGVDYEKYINDQFILRDSFINLKSISEIGLLKTENNNIVYGSGGYMFEKNIAFDRDILEGNIKSLKQFSDRIGSNMNTIVVPYSSSILKDKVPNNLSLVDEINIINKINNYISNSVDVSKTLEKNKTDYIYYRTDHHWTSYGAYLAYIEYCKAVEQEPIELNNLNDVQISNFLGTFYSKSKLFSAKADVLTYYEMSGVKMKIGDGEFQSIYKLENLEKRDKYSVFLDGNHSQIILENDRSINNKKLLVLKDSFANSFIPFIANNYNEVHVIDLRHYYGNLSEYIEKNNFENILALYSLKTLTEDTTISRIKF